MAINAASTRTVSSSFHHRSRWQVQVRKSAPPVWLQWLYTTLREQVEVVQFCCFFFTVSSTKLSGSKQEGTATRRHGVHDGRNGCAAVHLVAAESTCCDLCRGVHPSLCTRGLTLFDSINFIKHVVP